MYQGAYTMSDIEVLECTTPSVGSAESACPTASCASPTTPTTSEPSSTAESSEPEKPKGKWDALGYKPVRGYQDRVIARWLRSQRKQMRRFFEERGFPIYALRLDAIRRNPRMGMVEKNEAFREVLDDYAKQVTGQSVSAAVPAVGIPEATPALQPVAEGVDLRDQPEPQPDRAVERGLGVSADTTGSV